MSNRRHCEMPSAMHGPGGCSGHRQPLGIALNTKLNGKVVAQCNQGILPEQDEAREAVLVRLRAAAQTLHGKVAHATMSVPRRKSRGGFG